MNDGQLHRLYRHYSELPLSLRILYTAALFVLGYGYLFAGIYLFHTYSGKDGNAMDLSYDDLVISYSGSGKGSRLESALRGSMSTMLPPDESGPIVSWVQEGAERARYDREIRPILDKRCMTCHGGTNPHLVNLSGFDELKKVTEQDKGTDIFTLVRVSHIHLFGLTFIFFIMGTIFSHAYIRPVWFKCTVIALPFICVSVDVSSWYMVKLIHPFAFLTMAAGATMGLTFAFMWFVSMYQLWFGKTPPVIRSRESGNQQVVE